jgi:protein-S-isoprenylcysteine O-methyltransferase Ste14
MSLYDEYVQSGNRLFRARSYLPLLLLPGIALALRHYHYLGHSHAIDGVWEGACVSISFLGLLLRMAVAGSTVGQTSGRNTEGQEAASLNTRGLYSVVRHPLYLANFLIWLGIGAFAHSIVLVVVLVLAFWLYYERIMFAEESFLRERFGAAFIEWAKRTPAFVPAPRLWQAADTPLSWKRMLKREHSTLLSISVAFAVMDVVSDAAAGGRPDLDLSWTVLLAFSAVSYVILRTAKKRGYLSG